MGPSTFSETSFSSSASSSLEQTTLSSSAVEEHIQRSNRPKKSVSFGCIEIREHERSLDVNPSVTSGPAVGLDWAHYDLPTKYDLIEFELSRIPHRRMKTQFQMPRFYREALLLDLGYSRRDLTENIVEIKSVQRQRRKSLQRSKFEKLLLAVEGTDRFMKKILKRSPSIPELSSSSSSPEARLDLLRQTL